MQVHRRPPQAITPEQFFTEWLPTELERLGTSIIPPMVVRVRLDGEGGGVWDLDTTSGVLRVSAPEPTRRPLLTLRMQVRDWRAIVVGEEGPVSLTPPRASPTDLLFVDSGARQLLAAVTGTYRFEVREYNGRTWLLSATFGDEEVDPPTATIGIDAQTYAAILARQLAAPEAYFTGKITISGDAGRGMQVGLSLLPKL